MKKHVLFVAILLIGLLHQQPSLYARSITTPDVSSQLRGSLTSEQEAALRELCLAIWDPTVVSTWEMNEDLFYVVVDATKALGACDKGMDAVLKLVGTLTFQNLSRNVKTVASAIYKMQSLKPGIACKNTVAASFRTQAELASLGI